MLLTYIKCDSIFALYNKLAILYVCVVCAIYQWWFILSSYSIFGSRGSYYYETQQFGSKSNTFCVIIVVYVRGHGKRDLWLECEN